MTESRPSHKRFLNATAWAFAMNWGREGITGLITFVLAAILGPAAFGTIAIALVYVSFIQMFVSQSYGLAIIQRKDLEEQHLDSIFWIMLGLSLALTAVGVGLRNVWAQTYDIPELVAIITALSALIPIKALTVVQSAVLQRDMAFKSLALRSNVSAIIGGTVGLATALSGLGIWSLVAMHLTHAAADLVLLWSVSHWRPKMRFSKSHARDLLGFSVATLIANLFTFAWRNAETLIIGIFFGPVAVGLYRLANRAVETLVNLLTRSFQIVALPYFAPSQDSRDELKTKLLAGTRMTGTLTVPIVTMLAVASTEALLILGEDWLPADTAVQLLCIYAVVQAYTLLGGPALQAVSKPHLETGLMGVLAISICAASYTLGAALQNADPTLQVGAVAGARAGVMALIYMPLKFYFMRDVTHFSLRELASTILPSLTGGAVAFATVQSAATLGLFETLSPLGSGAIKAMSAGVIALTIILLLDRHARSAIRMLATGIRRAILNRNEIRA